MASLWFMGLMLMAAAGVSGMTFPREEKLVEDILDQSQQQEGKDNEAALQPVQPMSSDTALEVKPNPSAAQANQNRSPLGIFGSAVSVFGGGLLGPYQCMEILSLSGCDDVNSTALILSKVTLFKEDSYYAVMFGGRAELIKPICDGKKPVGAYATTQYYSEGAGWQPYIQFRRSDICKHLFLAPNVFDSVSKCSIGKEVPTKPPFTEGIYEVQNCTACLKASHFKILPYRRIKARGELRIDGEVAACGQVEGIIQPKGGSLSRGIFYI